MKNVVAHFQKVDPILAKVLAKFELQKIEKRDPGRFFVDLVESIVSQQLSVKASATIFGRFEKLFKGKITPQAILKLKDEDIRAVGISYSKIKYIKDLASKVQSGELDLENLDGLGDEEVVLELVKVKGIGRWTAEMFLMFALGREDVFSHGDQGLKNALAKIYKLEKPTLEQMEKIVNKWSPYKSYGARILWKSLDNQPI